MEGVILSELFKKITVKSADDQLVLDKLVKTKILLDPLTEEQSKEKEIIGSNMEHTKGKRIPAAKLKADLEPNFSSVFYDKLESLYRLKKGWLGNGDGEEIEPDTFARAIFLISKIRCLIAEEPSMCPTSEGGLEIGWGEVSGIVREDLTFCLIALPEHFDAAEIDTYAEEWNFSNINDIPKAILRITSTISNHSSVRYRQ